MKEARLIVPRHHQWQTVVEKRLTEAFGGFTLIFAHGGWKDKTGAFITEPVAVYDVAMDVTRDNRNKLMQIARETMVALNQEAVYVRLPSGDVLLVTRTMGQ